MKKIIAIIPARGGSKGVPKKNIRKLKGFPLIAYSIAVCLMAKNISEIIISTDSKEIASIAEKFGAKVPFLRPKSISRDSSRDIEFVKHAINFYKRKKNNTPKNWAIIRPTTPLRDPKKIDNAINKYFKIKDATSLVSVHEIAETPPKMFGMKGEYLHGLSPFDPREEYYTLPRQAFPPSYFGNGYIDIVNTKNTLTEAGESSVKLTLNQLPSHTHTNNARASASWGLSNHCGACYVRYDFNYGSKNAATSSVGNDQPHNNLPPYIVMAYFIYCPPGN